ncbi:MAG TPA: hypothetical protein VK454_05360 [Myxococcaceae bacterium]|nr:hypothetical protein [Myxococcaceae bacterium]
MLRFLRAPVLVVAGLALLAACSSSGSYACLGLCTAPDGGSVDLDDILSSDSQAGAQAACFAQMGTSLGMSCTAANATCDCAQQ